MFIFSLNFKISSSKKKDAINIFDSLSGPISVKPGCKRVKLFADINNNDELLLLEEWETKADLERHISSDEFRKIMALMDLANELPSISFHSVSSSEGFELVEKIREKVSN